MKSLTIDSKIFKELLESAADNLANQYPRIDALNVFPVPDGDTGTNMHLTFSAGVKDCLKEKSEHLGDLAKALSKGLLMGARGNSGVILSQIFRGFYQAVENKSEISVKEFAEAMVNGSQAAYKAIMRPVEGTILTVIRESSNQALVYLDKHSEADLNEYLEVLVAKAQISLDNTPKLLPILQEVGVVDSGGAGLLLILEGFLAAARGEKIEAKPVQSEISEGILISEESGEFGYCTEFIIDLRESINQDQEDMIKEELSRLGDSLAMVSDDDLLKVHIHTWQPGEVLNRFQRFGEFRKVKIENMQYQHDNFIEMPVAKKRQAYVIIAVANGQGISAAFKELQAEYIISGGQSMNPATEDFISVCESANADNIIILPNNKNIVLAAQQAALAYELGNVVVLATKNIPEGLSACIAFDSSLDLTTNLQVMQEAIDKTRCGAVTYAIKDTALNGLKIKANDYMGILGDDIVVTASNKLEAAKALLSRLCDSSTEILTIISGEEVSAEELKELLSYVNKEIKIEYEVIEGGQPVYSFIFGAE